MPKHGVWSFHHGDSSKIRGGPSCFWEFYYNWPHIGSTLQILNDRLDAGKVLYKSYTYNDPLSLARSTSMMYWKSLLFIPRVLNLLYMDKHKFYRKLSSSNDIVLYSNIIFKFPGILNWAYVLLRAFYRKFTKTLNLLFFEEKWNILISNGRGMSTEFFKFRKVDSLNNLSCADPFVIYHENSHYIFFENYNKK